ncbi:MAG: glycosyl hydrolase 2 galactose-binding domain-containing protein [Armatimonadota bacterium]
MRVIGNRILVTADAVLLLVMQVPAMAKSGLTDGKFGRAIDLSGDSRQVSIQLGSTLKRLPVTFEFWARIKSASTFNILLSVAPKSGAHWEIYTEPNTGTLSMYVPRLDTPDLHSNVSLSDGQWHYIAMRIGAKSVELYADGVRLFNVVSSRDLVFDASPLLAGAVAGEPMGCNGAIDELCISKRTDDMNGFVPNGPTLRTASSLHIYHFDEISNYRVVDDMPKNSAVEAHVKDSNMIPLGKRFLDEVQDEEYAKSTLHGDDMVEHESRLPVISVKAHTYSGKALKRDRSILSLSGEWLMQECDPWVPASTTSITVKESPGVTQGWYKTSFDRSAWRKVQVPTTVQNALVKSGELVDPFYNSNTYDELDKFGEPKAYGWTMRQTRTEQKDWWFARKFEMPSSMKGHSIRLYFDGIDYSASIYLNGYPLGHHTGMFGGPSLDVTGLVQFGAPNELVVRVDKAPLSWFGILKGSPGFGWHYGHLESLGIWRDVQIEAVPSIEIDSPYVVTRSINKNKAVLAIEYYIESKNPQPTDVSIVGTIQGGNFSSKAIGFENKMRVTYGRNRYRTEVTVDNPKLWWPLNYGKQNLYRLSLAGCSQNGPAQKVIDSESTVFGIRTIEMRPMAGTSEKTDYRWHFVINGQPMFIKGANWCWSDPMLKCDPAKYERLLELARRAGIQMFRAWGGGIIETDEFYRLCDEKGLMVYQEFPFCWGPPDFPYTDPAVLDQQVSRVVKRNRNHPSLVMWGGGNENVAITGSDDGLFLVGRRCRQYDPSRPFHRTDPWGGSIHNWAVFHNGLPIDSGYRATQSVFYGEYGLPSMTNKSSTLKYLPESAISQWPPDKSSTGVIYHMNQFSLGDLPKVLRYAADYGPVKSWDQYTEYSQMAQGDGLRFAGEMQRAGSNANKSGFWFYKFTDLFPGQSWAVVDFYGSPKLSYYRAKQTCRPVAAFASYEKLNWNDSEPFVATIHAANDTMQTVRGAKVKATIFGSDLLEQWSRDYTVPDMAPNERGDVETINVKLDPAKTKPFLLAVSMRSAEGDLISDQWYWFNFEVKTGKVEESEKIQAWGFPEDKAKDAFDAYAEIPEARLLNLPRTTLTLDTKTTGNRGYFIVKNIGNLPAFNVLIDDFPDGYHDFLDDNSFCLRAGEQRKISFELGDGHSLSQVRVRSWNAAAVQVK